jgi:hypothetical protein
MEQQPFRFMSFKDFVPNSLRFWIYMLFLAIFQFSNGIYWTEMSFMEGELGIFSNDTKLMSYAVLVGLTMYFPVAFRLKFFWTNRTCLIIAASTLLVCNLLIPHIHSTPILILLCFIAGFARLFGTFECLSNVLPKVAPTHNYSVFLSLVFFVVLGVISAFDIATTNLIYYFNWEYVHLLAIGLLLVVILIAFIFMQPFRQMPKMKLYGIDWLGMLLWSIFILSLVFIFQYGEQFEWLEGGEHIRVALGIAFISLGINIWRTFNVRHPFIEKEAWNSKNLVNMLLIFLLLDILLTAKLQLQNIFTMEILQFDVLNNASIKWFEVIGMLSGAFFSYFAITHLKLHKKFITFIGMFFVVLYCFIMYFLITPELNIEMLYLPVLFCAFGQVVIFITLTVYAQATAPFKNYFQVVCILGFVRTGIGAPIGEAIYSRALTGLFEKNLSLLGEVGANNYLPLLISLQELYGYSVILGICVLIIIAGSRFQKHIGRPMPIIRRMYAIVSKEG